MSFSVTTLKADRYLLKNNKYFILQSIILSFVAVIAYSRVPSHLFPAAMIAMSVCMASLFNFYIMFSLFIALILYPAGTFLHLSVLFTPLLLTSLLLNFKGELKEGFRLPVMPSILMFMLACLPSFFNTPQLLLSIRDSYNLVAFIIVIVATVIAIDSPKYVLRIFYGFIIGLLFHSILVIIPGLTSGRREFGLLGVYYIDPAGLSVLYCLILFFYSKGIKKILWMAAFGIILFGLILTQTRNAWFSTAFAIYSLLLFLLFTSKRFGLNKKHVLYTLVVFTFISVAAYFVAANINSGIGERLEISQKSTAMTDASEIFGQNSLASRGLIWFTAYNAFTIHPVFGIGLYSFQYTSDYYYTIPKELYKLFVANKTPHVTFIEVITETGILGFIFFIYFLYTLIKYSIKSLKIHQSGEESRRTILIVWSFVYIVFSMFMTEAWLYGQFLMWFGVLIGLLHKNYQFSKTKEELTLC